MRRMAIILWVSWILRNFGVLPKSGMGVSPVGARNRKDRRDAHPTLSASSDELRRWRELACDAREPVARPGKALASARLPCLCRSTGTTSSPPSGRYESQIACSRSGNKAHGAASIHIGIASGSVNKMNGVRNNAAQMQKNAASKITGINNTNGSCRGLN